MSKKEQVKSNIETIRAVFLAFLGALFGVCGYTFYERKGLNAYELAFLGVVALVITAVLFACALFYYKQTKKLKDL